MITDFFKNINDFFSNLLSEFTSWVMTVVNWVLSAAFAPISYYILPWLAGQGFSLEIPDEVFNVLNEITYGVGYILPLWALLPIVWFMLSFYFVKIVLSVFKGVTSFLSFGLK